MDSLLLTSAFSLDDRAKRIQIVVGLASTENVVVVIKPPRSPSFILSSDDWNLLGERLRVLAGESELTDIGFYDMNNCKMMYTPQRQLTLTYYPSWKDILLNAAPQSLTLSAKATGTLVNMLSTINSIVTRMSSLAAFTSAGQVGTTIPSISETNADYSTQLAAPEDFGFYNERS